ncbi:MAG TPA: hypothetical protein VH186_28095 [Chloroflexia bacterium]|nr:hypothetical protein [Chloroflexia bacterium]
MRHRTKQLKVGLIFVILALLLQVTPVLAEGQGNNPKVLPPQSSAFGKTYGEWSAMWWQWAFSIPVPDNPLLDQTGEKCGVGQSGKVWFLVGTFVNTLTPTGDTLGQATRNCTIPAGKAIFFPILNAEWDEIGQNPPLTVEQLRQLAADAMDTTKNLSASVDGHSIRLTDNNGKQIYRVTSPVFSFTLPEDNIYGQPAGDYYPVVGDGVYLMLAPLSVGTHTIHFHGESSLPDGSSFILDITYHLMVK